MDIDNPELNSGTATTQSAGNNTTKVATTEYVDTAVAAISVDHGNLTGLSDDDHTQYSLISSQAGAPSSTPGRVGEVNVDTTADAAYVAVGTASSADWVIVSGGTSDYQGAVVTRDANEFISLITRDDATTATISRDGNNFITTIVDTATGQTITFTRDGNNRISSWAVS